MKNNYAYGSLAPYLDVEGLTLPLDRATVFGRTAPLEVEIGFGTGEYLTKISSDDKSCDFIGFEQCAKRTIKTLRKVHEARLTNVRLLNIDAVWGFEYLLAPKSLRKVHCLFPCPWPKKRHAKHRLFQPDVLRLINSRLMAGGELLIVTDHRPYADWIVENLSGTGFVCRPRTIGAQYDTKFEKKWREAGQEEFFSLALLKDQDMSSDIKQGEVVRVYFLEKVVPEKIRFVGSDGEVSIEFAEFVNDAQAHKAMVHAIVTEDSKTQHLWIMIAKTAKGDWRVAAAHGTAVLPTPGIQKALALAFEAAQKSGT